MTNKEKQIAIEGNSICEIMYRLRDAVQANKLNYALMLSREIYEKLMHLTQTKEDIDCRLECDIKNKE